MTTFTVHPAERRQLDELASLAEVAQRSPDTFNAHLGEERTAIATDIAEVDRWAERTAVAVAGGRVRGWLLAETDAELDRVWWWGPVVEPALPWDEVADELYGAARAGLGGRFEQEELAGDDRSVVLAAFAGRHGFEAQEASVLLQVTIGAHDANHRITEMTALDADEVAALHDATFPGTHTTGRQLVDGGERLRLVVRDGPDLAGYVALEIHAGGGGYIDFLGVDPGHRNRGYGRALVAAALHELAQRGVTGAHLTVREDNAAARALYAGLGFEEVRILRPFRRGFTIE